MSVPLRAVQLTEPSLFLQEHPEVQFVDLLISDMNGVVRGKRIERNSLPKVFEKGINLPASLFALDITGSTVESTGLGLDIGDADRICYPIPGTLSMEPWQKRPTAQLLMTMHELEGDPFFADPREVLRQVVARFTEMELTIVAAFELEFYLIDQENVNGRPQPPRSPISGKRPQSVQVYSIDDLDEYVECLQDIIDGARAQGIPADAIVAESASAVGAGVLHRRPRRIRRVPPGHHRRRPRPGHPGRRHRRRIRTGAVRGQPASRRRPDEGLRLCGAAQAPDQEHRLRP